MTSFGFKNQNKNQKIINCSLPILDAVGIAVNVEILEPADSSSSAIGSVLFLLPDQLVAAVEC
jgi:hypothetical protein